MWRTLNVTRDALDASLSSRAPASATRDLHLTPIEGGGDASAPLHAARTGHVDALAAFVEGAQPRGPPLHTGRLVDPLAPDYQLPGAPGYRPPSPLPFKRDLFNVHDIEGARPTKVYYRGERAAEALEPLRSRSLGRARIDRAADHDDVSDITGARFASRRVTEPLSPAYAVHGRVVADDAGATHPAPRHVRCRDGPVLSLTTADIAGAGTADGRTAAPVGGIPLHRRRDFRVTNSLAGIDAARAGSRARGPPPRAARATDPNERDYVVPGGGHAAADAITDEPAARPVGRSRYHATLARLAVATAAATATTAGAGADTIGAGGDGSGCGDASTRGAASARRSVSAAPGLRAHLVRRADPRDAEIAALRASLRGGGGGAAPAFAAADHLRAAATWADAAGGGDGVTSEHRRAFTGRDSIGVQPAGAPGWFFDSATVERTWQGPPRGALDRPRGRAHHAATAGGDGPEKAATLYATLPHHEQPQSAAARLRATRGATATGATSGDGERADTPPAIFAATGWHAAHIVRGPAGDGSACVSLPRAGRTLVAASAPPRGDGGEGLVSSAEVGAVARARAVSPVRMRAAAHGPDNSNTASSAGVHAAVDGVGGTTGGAPFKLAGVGRRGGGAGRAEASTMTTTTRASVGRDADRTADIAAVRGLHI